MPTGSETRIGIDRDSDGYFNQDEVANSANPADADSTPAAAVCAAPTNIAPTGQASQSSEFGNARFPASNAIDGNLGNFTHTATGQPDANWTLEFAEEHLIKSITLHNRDNCCGSRLRDITVYVLDATGEQAVFKSHFLNRHNREDAPDTLTVDLVAINGAPVKGQFVRIVRTPDPLGIGGAGNGDEPTVLSLGEVEVVGCELATPVLPSNVAPLGEATQSSGWSGDRFPANLAIDGDLGNFTHTQRGQQNATWELKLDKPYTVNKVILHNRDNCCGSRLRDITVSILDAAGNIAFESELLNPENTLGSPDTITVTIPDIAAHSIRVHRTPDTDLSGSNGSGNADEGIVLSLGEVEVWAY